MTLRLAVKLGALAAASAAAAAAAVAAAGCVACAGLVVTCSSAGDAAYAADGITCGWAATVLLLALPRAAVEATSLGGLLQEAAVHCLHLNMLHCQSAALLL
jgi:hypothetical protein